MNDLIADDDARRRYDAICDALGGEPVAGYSRAVFARLSAWWADPDVDVVAQEIKYAIGRAIQPYAALIAETASLVADAIENGSTRDADLVSVGMPVRLALRIMRAARND